MATHILVAAKLAAFASCSRLDLPETPRNRPSDIVIVQ
tara:strand:+ start:74889 stop:75002 length:114 start_codon:yes stop_codon:yes gene_type:complete